MKSSIMLNSMTSLSNTGDQMGLWIPILIAIILLAIVAVVVTLIVKNRRNKDNQGSRPSVGKHSK